MLQGRMRKIDKRTTLPLRVPENGGRLHEASSCSGRSRCQTAKVAPISGLPEIGNFRCAGRASPTCVRRSRARDCAAHMHGNPFRSMRAQPRMRTRERMLGSCRSGRSEFCYGPIGSLLPVWRRGFGPPPVSLSLSTLVGSVRSRMGSPVRCTRLGRRPVVRTTRRWRR